MTAPAPNVLNVYAAEPLATGCLYVAPLGTPKPALVTTALATPWIGLGHVGEDGVTETQDRSIDKKKNWGGATVKILQTDYVHTFKFVLLESLNAEVLKVVYGPNNVTVTAATSTKGTQISVTKNPKKLPKLTWCVDSTDSELAAFYRNYVPIGQIMTVGDVKIVHTDTIEYSLEMEAFPDASGNHVYLLTDDGVKTA
jgi:hypothetical protein